MRATGGLQPVFSGPTRMARLTTVDNYRKETSPHEQDRARGNAGAARCSGLVRIALQRT